MTERQITLKAGLGFTGSLQANVLVKVGPARVLAGAGTPTVTITSDPSSSVPRVDLGPLDKNKWDFATIGFGVGVGGVIGHLPGAVIGGVVMVAWGQWRWRKAKSGT